MRIRGRPQALIPSPLQQDLASEPPTEPQPLPPTNAQKEGEVEEEKLGELRCPSPNMDLGDEPSLPALPLQPQIHSAQGGNVMARSSENAPDGGGAQRQGAADAHRSLENGEHDISGWLVTNAGERAINGVMPAMPLESIVSLNMKEGITSDGPKRRHRLAVRLEGSRCSRVNGRGWRCCQPMLFGYSLCHHTTSARPASLGGCPSLAAPSPSTAGRASRHRP
ncbi:hypothetical protein ACQ4PT_069940 [Festuca glaucescens]